MDLNIIKAIHDKRMAIVLNGKTFKTFLLRSGTRETRMPTLSTPSRLEPGALARETRQEKEVKGIHIRREVKLFADNIYSVCMVKRRTL